ncbi:hypothetical protein [Flavihumibacter sp. ZG627]|uniref:hypothetical protein n=1 Tax=Flavihumibacter sp. ZG627 TaxID=1463156 RepID=UPI0006936830|nr:hypothetical protein [Flavihumibacter sp. ZG627]
MAKNKGNILLKNFSGKIGDLFYLKNLGEDQYLITNPSRKSHKKTEGEAANQNRFKRAQKYGSNVIKNPEAKAFYTPFRTAKQAEYHIAQSDKLIPPVIDSYDSSGYKGLSGQPILIIATDNVKVVEVTCTLINAAGKILETGRAEETGIINQWMYYGQKDHQLEEGSRLILHAFDRPRNKAETIIPLIA